MSDKKKKGGCLKIGFTAFAVLMGLGIILNFFDDQSWKKNRAALIEQITQAKAADDFEKAYELTQPHLDRVNTDEEFASLTTEVIDWYKRQEWNKILAEFRVAYGAKNYDQVLALATQHKSQLDQAPELVSIIQEAKKWQKARDAEALVTKKKAEAEALASIPLHQRIKDRLHLKIGSKTSLFGDDRTWKKLRNVDAVEENDHASISLNNELSELSIFNDVSKVIETVLEFEEINSIHVQVFSEYIDTNGEISSLPFVNVNITREAAHQANWKNLRSHYKVQQFLEKKGEVIIRGEK